MINKSSVNTNTLPFASFNGKISALLLFFYFTFLIIMHQLYNLG